MTPSPICSITLFIVLFDILRLSTSSSGFLTSTLFTFQNTACDGEKIRLHCPKTTMISIQSAEYGRLVPSYRMCPPDKAVSSSGYSVYSVYDQDIFQENTNCLATTSFRVLLDRCQNRQHCNLVASTETFRQDPCPQTSKYLKVAFKCNPNNFTNETVCEGGHLSLTCEKSTRIAIYSAMFGRTSQDTLTCSQDISYADCRSNTAIEEVMKRCHGRKRCALEAEEYIFGNPCPAGIPKYLNVVYTCVPKKILKQIGRHNHKKKKRKKHKHTTESTIGSSIPSTTYSSLPDIFPADDAKQRPGSIVRTGNLEEGPPHKVTKNGVEVMPAITSVLCENYTTLKPPGGGQGNRGRFEQGASGLVVEWFRSFNYLTENKEKAFLYMTLGMCFGVITLLFIVVIKLLIMNKRKQRAKLDVTDPVHRNAHAPSNHLEAPTLSRTESIDRIEVVRFEPRGTLRRDFERHDFENPGPLRTDFDPSSTLLSDQSDRGNYYG